VSRVGPFRAQTHIILWTLACILPMLGGALFATWRLAEAQQDSDRRQILQTAHVLSAAIDLKLEKGLAALAALGTSPALAGGDFAAFYVQCTGVAAQHDAVIVVVDESGNELVNTAVAFGTQLRPLTYKGRALQALTEGRPQVSGLFRSTTLDALQVASYMPVSMPGGRRFVLIMSFGVGEFSRILAAQHTPETWTLSIADRDGRILGRSHALDRFAGTPIGSNLRAQIAKASQGTYIGTNREATEVLAAFATSALSGWSVIVGIPLSEINAPLVKSVSLTVAVTLLLLAVALVAAGLIGRRFVRLLHGLRAAAMNAARGEAPAPIRSTIAEVNALADSLAEAAAVADRRSRELAQQTATLTMLVENLPIAVSLVGPDNRYLAFNQLFLEQMDLSPGELKLGDPVEKFVRHLAACGDYGAGDVETLVRQRFARMTARKPEQFEATRPNGRILDVRITPLPDGGFISTRVDVTDRRRREIEIEQARERLERHAAELTVARQQADRARAAADAANTAKSLFLANMSHELRTPLNAILGFSEIIGSARFGPGDIRYQQYGHDIHVSGQHLLRLINDLLDQSRIEIGQLGLREDEFDLAELIDECRQVVAARAEDGRVALTGAVAPALPPVRADRARLKQVLLNLLSNAIKFTPEGGQVRITARPAADGGLAIAVADSGIGMRTEDIPTAFEPFRQVDNSLTRHYDGAGLGLSLAKGLTELHGGRLDIQSAVGKGTLATVWLPPARLVVEAAPKIAAAGD